MERRAFLRGTFGLVAIACTAGLSAVAGRASDAGDGVMYVTPEVSSPEAAVGPAMAAGLELVRVDDCVEGLYGGERLFVVDDMGAELVELADGSRTIDEIATSTSEAVAPADVASFFVTLGQAGYLQNEVYVNLLEVSA